MAGRSHTPLLPGTKLGRLIVLDVPPRLLGKGNYQYYCRCICGNENWFYSYKLKTSHTTSCGCYRAEQTGLRNKSRSKK